MLIDMFQIIISTATFNLVGSVPGLLDRQIRMTGIGTVLSGQPPD